MLYILKGLDRLWTFRFSSADVYTIPGNQESHLQLSRIQGDREAGRKHRDPTFHLLKANLITHIAPGRNLVKKNVSVS